MKRREFLKGLGAIAVGLLLPKRKEEPEKQNKYDLRFLPSAPVSFDKWLNWNRDKQEWIDAPKENYANINWEWFDKTCGPLQWEIIESDECLSDSEDLV